MRAAPHRCWCSTLPAPCIIPFLRSWSPDMYSKSWINVQFTFWLLDRIHRTYKSVCMTSPSGQSIYLPLFGSVPLQALALRLAFPHGNTNRHLAFRCILVWAGPASCAYLIWSRLFLKWRCICWYWEESHILAAFHSLFEIIISITGKPSQQLLSLLSLSQILFCVISHPIIFLNSYFNHSVWHLFVLAGSIFHWSGVYIIAK